jgi:hypothetical protein
VSTKAKTTATKKNVNDYVDTIENPQHQQDAKVLIKLMQQITGEKPVIWGTKIIGFGQYHYKYESGREGDCPLVSFAISKQGLTLYLMSGFFGYESLLKKLDNPKTGKACLYIKSLKSVDLSVLTTLIERSIKSIQEKYIV